MLVQAGRLSNRQQQVRSCCCPSMETLTLPQCYTMGKGVSRKPFHTHAPGSLSALSEQEAVQCRPYLEQAVEGALALV